MRTGHCAWPDRPSKRDTNRSALLGRLARVGFLVAWVSKELFVGSAQIFVPAFAIGEFPLAREVILIPSGPVQLKQQFAGRSNGSQGNARRHQSHAIAHFYEVK